MAGKDEVPSTVERSDGKAERTWASTYDSAMGSYDGDGARARRTAFSALKHTHEKVGDHWEPKAEFGPSDEQAAHGTADTDLGSAGGVDANASKKHLYELAQRLEVPGRSSMTKEELVEALQKASTRATAQARRR